MVYDTYLAANTPQGFVSRFDQLNRESLRRLFIVKGTSGNGKSTVMRRVAEALAADGAEVERIHCSADAASLDGVIFPSLGAAILDGTAPHAVEPRYPFAFETVVSLFDALDGAAIWARRDEVFRYNDENRALLERAGRLIAAAGSLETDSARLLDGCIDQLKLHRAALRLSRRLFGKPSASPGVEQIRFLTAIGGETFLSAVTARCGLIFQLDDDVGASRHFLAAVRGIGRAAGQRVVSCPCPMRPADRLEHLIFPDAGIGFVTSNAAHRLSLPDARRINCRRFADLPRLREIAPRLTQNRRMGRELLRNAVETLAGAKKAHDALESVYAGALCEEVLREKERALIETLRGMASG